MMNRVAEAIGNTENSAPAAPHTDRIKSFVRRCGRMTRAQQLGWTELFPQQGLTIESGPLDVEATFGRQAPLVVEIGFGMGESLLAMAANQPDHHFIGIDVHRAGVGSLLYKADQMGLTNLRVYCDDAFEVLRTCFAENSIDRMQVYFPDPWHKARHNKRRLINPAFMDLVSPRVKTAGTLHLATDWEDYAQHMMEVLGQASGWKNLAGTGLYSDRPDWRPLTRFEQKGQRKGHIIRDLLFEKTA